MQMSPQEQLIDWMFAARESSNRNTMATTEADRQMLAHLRSLDLLDLLLHPTDTTKFTNLFINMALHERHSIVMHIGQGHNLAMRDDIDTPSCLPRLSWVENEFGEEGLVGVAFPCRCRRDQLQVERFSERISTMMVEYFTGITGLEMYFYGCGITSALTGYLNSSRFIQDLRIFFAHGTVNGWLIDAQHGAEAKHFEGQVRSVRALFDALNNMTCLRSLILDNLIVKFNPNPEEVLMPFLLHLSEFAISSNGEAGIFVRSFRSFADSSHLTSIALGTVIELDSTFYEFLLFSSRLARKFIYLNIGRYPSNRLGHFFGNFNQLRTLKLQKNPLHSIQRLFEDLSTLPDLSYLTLILDPTDPLGINLTDDQIYAWRYVTKLPTVKVAKLHLYGLQVRFPFFLAFPDVQVVHLDVLNGDANYLYDAFCKQHNCPNLKEILQFN